MTWRINIGMLDVEATLFAYDGLPTYISKLTDLRILDVGTTLFYGELDGAIFAPLQELIYLALGDNWYNSSFPIEIAELPKLEALYAYDCGLQGELDFAPKMNSIFELWLDDNPDIVGTIPTEISEMTSLASLSISNCDLSGQIPSEIGQLTLMEQMWLFGNWFSGTIPSEIGLMTELQIMGLEDNNITDTSMPQEICDLNLQGLGADCRGDWNLECDCCSCCEPPCPVVDIFLYDPVRRLSLL
jgi:Leucine-rich repeat (LRR) protein